jgi:hypothetical protein
LIAHGHRDGATRIHGFRAAHKAVGAGHGDAAHNVVADVLRHLQRDGVGPFSTVMAFSRPGRCPSGNLMSSTGPMIWVTVPMF